VKEVKLYFDFKIPFAFLAKDPAFELPRRFEPCVGWIPFTPRLEGKGERSICSQYKARCSYLDARRWANRRGGFPIKGPLEIDRPGEVATLIDEPGSGGAAFLDYLEGTGAADFAAR